MCEGCGGTCGASGRPRARFTQPAGTADLRIVGTNMAPTMQPGHRVLQGPDVVQYETLFTGLGPNGEAVATVIPGTFGQVVRAGRGR